MLKLPCLPLARLIGQIAAAAFLKDGVPQGKERLRGVGGSQVAVQGQDGGGLGIGYGPAVPHQAAFTPIRSRLHHQGLKGKGPQHSIGHDDQPGAGIHPGERRGQDLLI